MTPQDFLNKFIANFLSSFQKENAQIKFKIEDANAYIKNKFLSKLIMPDEVVKLFDKMYANTLLQQSDIDNLRVQLTSIKQNNKALHDFCVGMIYVLELVVFQSYSGEVSTAVSAIEMHVQEGVDVKTEKNQTDSFNKLLNISILDDIQTTVSCQNQFPGLTLDEELVLNYDISMGVNALVLIGKIENKSFGCIDLSRPMYPRNLQTRDTEMLDLKSGIKDTNEYYPFKRQSKLAGIGRGDDTFLSTNGKKIIYMRGRRPYSPAAVLSSKIATLISRKNFSSERLFSNLLSGSRKQDACRAPVVDKSVSGKIDELTSSKFYFPGTGMIDEVLNLLGERDRNAENYALSDNDLKKAYVVKIDFDNCDLANPISEKLYESNILTSSRAIYKSAQDVRSSSEYLDEKLFARLKIILISHRLIASLAEKAYTASQKNEMNHAINEINNRIKVAWILLISDPNITLFLSKRPHVINDLVADIVKYIDRHFKSPVKDKLIESLISRAIDVNYKLQIKTGLKLEEIHTTYSNTKLTREKFKDIVNELDKLIHSRTCLFPSLPFQNRIAILERISLVSLKDTLVHLDSMNACDTKSLIVYTSAVKTLNIVLRNLMRNKEFVEDGIEYGESNIKLLFKSILSNWPLIDGSKSDEEINKILKLESDSFGRSIIKSLVAFIKKENEPTNHVSSKAQSSLSSDLDGIISIVKGTKKSFGY